MRIEIMMIGKIPEKPYREIVENYLSRCSGRLQVDLVHCRDTDEMKRRTSDRAHVVTLDERGKELTTMQFVDWLKTKINSGVNRISFCLGAAAGLDPDVKKTASDSFALSRFTLNHQLALLLFSEQLYRGISILFGEPYHKS